MTVWERVTVWSTHAIKETKQKSSLCKNSFCFGGLTTPLTLGWKILSFSLLVWNIKHIEMCCEAISTRTREPETQWKWQHLPCPLSLYGWPRRFRTRNNYSVHWVQFSPERLVLRRVLWPSSTNLATKKYLNKFSYHDWSHLCSQSKLFKTAFSQSFVNFIVSKLFFSCHFTYFFLLLSHLPLSHFMIINLTKSHCFLLLPSTPPFRPSWYFI